MTKVINLGRIDHDANPNAMSISLNFTQAYDIMCLVSNGDRVKVKFKHRKKRFLKNFTFKLDYPTYCECCGPVFNSAELVRTPAFISFV